MAAASTSRSPSSTSSPFPPAPPRQAGAAGPSAPAKRARSPAGNSHSAFLREVLDASAQHFGNPNSLPGPPPSHFFPSVPRAQRDKARQARLASSPSPPPPPVPPKSSSPVEEHDEQALAVRQRQAKVELAAAGPFDNRRPSLPAAAGASSNSTVVQQGKSVGTGGSGGTKRRFRESDRTSWDAASELVLLEKERERAQRAKVPAAVHRVEADEDKEKTPTPSVAASFAGPRPVETGAAATPRIEVDDEDAAMGDDAERSASPPETDGRPSAAPSFVSASSGGGGEDDDELDDAMTFDDVSVRSGVSQGSKATGADDSTKEPAKKRSRTLTTPAQTAVLNALLAKTRFPSTETREEVGKQIGMSARRVQIWFQNRRQSQKRQRDREAQEAAAVNFVGHGYGQHHHQQPIYQHPYAPHAHIDPYTSQAAHFYPPLKPSAPVPVASPFAHLPSAAEAAAGSRPELHHRASHDSLASRASFASAAAQSQHSGISSLHAVSTHGSERDGLGPLPSDARFAHQYGAGYAAASPYGRQYAHPAHHPTELGHAYPGYRPGAASLSIPSKLYFPHVPRSQPHGPLGRVQVSHPSLTSPPMANGAPPAALSHDSRLPSLSSTLSGPPVPTASSSAPPPPPPAPVQAPIARPSSPQPMFSHSPFSPPPTHASLSVPAPPPVPAPAPAPSFNRAMFSPEPSSSSFERLRISSGPFSPPPPGHSLASPISPLSPTSSHPLSTPATPATTVAASPAGNGDVDILDVAVETMAYRPSGRHLPARQLLPPLRSVFGDGSTLGRKVNKGGKSEADKALLAPIKPSAASPSSSSNTSVPPRLAPISSFAPLTAPSPPHQHLPTPVSAASTATPASLRASTWSDHSHSTAATRSTADFEFAHPPPGSSRAAAAAASAGAGGWAVPTSATRERGGSVATSVRTSVSSDAGGGK
ncbi:hypothetical protein JCM8097_006810 [Rhodosporidiobolus ruineniae]